MKPEEIEKRRKKYITLIHVGRSKLGLSDDDFREMKRGLTGKDSCRDMSLAQLRGLHRRMKDFGWKPTPHPSAKESGMTLPPAAVKARQLEKIGAFLADAELSWGYADGIAKRMYGVERVRFCSPEELQSVIAALAKRKLKRDGTYGPPF